MTQDNNTTPAATRSQQKKSKVQRGKNSDIKRYQTIGMIGTWNVNLSNGQTPDEFAKLLRTVMPRFMKTSPEVKAFMKNRRCKIAELGISEIENIGEQNLVSLGVIIIRQISAAGEVFRTPEAHEQLMPELEVGLSKLGSALGDWKTSLGDFSHECLITSPSCSLTGVKASCGETSLLLDYAFQGRDKLLPKYSGQLKSNTVV